MMNPILNPNLTHIAPLSYGMAGATYAVLAAVLLIKRKKQWQWSLFFLSATIASIWAVTMTGFSTAPLAPTSEALSQIVEVLRSACWILFMLSLVHPINSGTSVGKSSLPDSLRSSLRMRPYAAVIGAYLAALLIATALVVSGMLPMAFGVVMITGRVLLAVIGMLMVEHVFRTASQHDRWSLKYVCLALACMFFCDFYLYSDAMLFHAVNREIDSARGFVNALLLPLFLISLNRDLKWLTGIGVSRRILFHSATLIGSSAYLLIMAAAGYYLRYFGGQWGVVLQMSFLFGAGIVLVTLLFSGSLRAWLRVFISKHFYQYTYDYRDEWIRLTRVLSDAGPMLGERAIEAVAQLVESGAGTLLVQRESGEFEPCARWNAKQACEPIPAGSALCRFMQEKNWVIDFREYHSFPGRYDHILIDRSLLNFPDAWLLIPLVFQGRLFGIILLEQARSRIELNWEVLDVLKIAASQVVSYLAQQESANALMLSRQFESFNRMSTFMVHDLKNLVAQLSLMLRNAERHQNNPVFQKDMLDTIDNSVQKMKTLLQKLAHGVDVENMSELALDQLIKRVVETKSPYEPQPQLDISEAPILVYANRERLERVVGHIVQNAIEATPRDGEIKIRLRRHDDMVELDVTDSGSGMSEEFIREKLFSPFVSTKVAGMGIGVFETREYIHQLGGKLDVVSKLKFGTSFKIILPAYVRKELTAARVA